MKQTVDDLVSTKEHRSYLRDVQRRSRRARWSTRARYVSIHLSWIVVLLAGAAISLVEALELPRAVAPLLGFVVVVFQGVDRIFDRTSRGSIAMDQLRRNLAGEERQLLGRVGDYAAAEHPVDLFAERCEELLKQNDDAMIAYFADLPRGADK